MLPNFWRVPTDNDLGWKVPELMGAWKDAGRSAKLHSLEGATSAEGATISAELTLPVKHALLGLTYILRPDGTLRMIVALNIPQAAPELPRIGMQLAIPGTWNSIAWFGRGPHESYPDRKTSAAIGLYRSTVEDWITPYVRPQENANRTDVRWIEFGEPAGARLRISATDRLLGISAWPYTQEDLATATHHHLLPRRDSITVNVDGFQMGVGGDTSWGRTGP